MTSRISFLKFWLVFSLIFALFVFNRDSVFAQCNKTTLSGNGSGIACSYDGSTCYADCASGWSESCSSGYSDSGTARCYINNSNCNNIATCYRCQTGQRYYYCNTSSHTCGQTNSTYTDYSSCQRNLSIYMPGQTDGYCYSSGSACSMNCAAPTPECTRDSQCNDYDSCTTDTCSGGNCVNRDNGSCCTRNSQCDDYNSCTTDTCSNRTCINRDNGSCCTSNSQCNDYDSCTTDTCSNRTCVNVDNGSCVTRTPTPTPTRTPTPTPTRTPTPTPTPIASCVFPHCDDTSYTWAVNCGAGDCEDMNYWKNQVYWVCCRPGLSYLCKSSGGANGVGCYAEEMCSSCGGDCINEQCPTTCHTGTVMVKGGEISGWCSYKGCPANQINGSCGAAQGGEYGSSKPSTDLCYYGTPSSVTNDGIRWNWTCTGTSSGGCATPGTTATCWASSNRAPIISSLDIKNDAGSIVPPESGSRNQICQTVFNNSRRVYFVVNASDPDGNSTIENVTLTWNGQTIPRISNIGASTVFGGYFPANWANNPTTSGLIAIVTDVGGLSDVDGTRLFRFWNCNVSVSGSIYDSTDDGGPNCPTVGFTKLAPKDDLNFKSLAFVKGGVGVSMSVNSDGVSYTNGSNYLAWGVDGYVPVFNSDVSFTNKSMRSKPTTVSNWDCNWYLDTTKADGYADNPTITADFSGIVVQSPWWQTNEGGAISNTEAIGKIPVTCSDATCKISRNALLSAPLISNATNKSLTDSQLWYYNGSGAKLVEVNSNYGYFYDKYLVKKGQGTTLATGDRKMSDITNTSGIYFVDGNFNIDTNKVTNDAFFMVIVKGDITVDQAVVRVDGIYVANNITASGISDNQLVFNGSLFASSAVNFSRDYSNRLLNNASPSVIVNYNPKLIFELPGSLAKILVNWQWGN